MNVTAFQNTATQYRSELLMQTVIGMEELLPHITVRPGIQDEEAVGNLSEDVELRPHNGDKNVQDTFALGKRTLKVYTGDVIAEENPEELRSTIYGRKMIGDSAAGTKHPLEFEIMQLIMQGVSGKLAKAAFKAVRNSSGTKTIHLFNGFDTLALSDITATTISTANGNLIDVDEITAVNAVDVLRSIWKNASDELKSKKTKLYIPFNVYENYCDAYRDDFGAVPYNSQFEKVTLEGTRGMCELVPVVGKAGSSLIHLTTKENMLIGVDQMSDKEYIEVRRGDNPFKWQFILKMVFGAQMASIDKRSLMIARIASGSN